MRVRVDDYVIVKAAKDEGPKNKKKKNALKMNARSKQSLLLGSSLPDSGVGGRGPQ